MQTQTAITSGATQPVLTIDNLSIEFPAYKGTVKALNGVSLHVNPGEIVGVMASPVQASPSLRCLACACCPSAPIRSKADR